MVKKGKYHLIAVNEPIVQDLASALKAQGASVTGPDGTSSLEDVKVGLDAVILGPGTPRDHPQLQKALTLKLKIQSCSEFISQWSGNKHRVVVAGGYGKTLIVLMIIHVLNHFKRSFDYVVARKGAGVGSSVRLSDAALLIAEGQDVQSSVLDPTPIFLSYKHHIGVICGIEWQESASFPTKEAFVNGFRQFEKNTPKGGVLIYFDWEPVLAVLAKENVSDVMYVPYKTHPSQFENGQEILISSEREKYPIKLTGKHNLQSIAAAKETLKKLGITSEMFYEAIPSFEG